MLLSTKTLEFFGKFKTDALLRTLGAVFLIAVVVRLLVLWFMFAHGGIETLMLGDTRRYLSLADSVLQGNGYDCGACRFA